jgi:3-oxoisoapionate decarboxylase
MKSADSLAHERVSRPPSVPRMQRDNPAADLQSAPARREFLIAIITGAAGLRLPSEARTTMCLAYTSFVVRMLQGRDILKTTAAALGADTFFELCHRAGASGCQLDLSQLESHDPEYLRRLRARLEQLQLVIELSVPSKWFESEDALDEVAAVASALGASRLRVALLYGRRYESFSTRQEWRAFAGRWRATLRDRRARIERHRLRVGIENHKDWLTPELVELLRHLDSPYIGACVDFGNNVAMLEDPLDTVQALAPFAVTTHLKDMAVRETSDGFELSEVPLGRGFLPLARLLDVLRRAQPEIRFVLEMITRDPLPVPYRTDRYWIAFEDEARAPERVRRFEQSVLARATKAPLPRTTGLSPEQQLAAEDDNVAVSVRFARDELGLRV